VNHEPAGIHVKGLLGKTSSPFLFGEGHKEKEDKKDSTRTYYVRFSLDNN